jgi:alpha-tubulin suppressor-like RCC1 family protein
VCWGEYYGGQPGDERASTNSRTPVDIAGLTDGVVGLDADFENTCALTAAGGVKCWGPPYHSKPEDTPGFSDGMIAIATGPTHTCGITRDGGLKCLGKNEFGQLGDGTTTTRTTAVEVVGLARGVTDVSVGSRKTCAVTTSEGLKCWGANGGGQLGDGTTLDRSTPVDVVGLTSGVASVVVGGSHTCAVTTAGGLKCWGSNRLGQLGDGTLTDRTTPVDVVGLSSGVADVTTGSYGFTCAATTVGAVKCWGSNLSGQLGAETTALCGDFARPCSKTPVDVDGLTTSVRALAAGALHVCAVTTAGGVLCWGDNQEGQLSDDGRTFPVGPTITVDDW